MANRKPYAGLAGYKCSRRNDINENHVVILDAKKASLDEIGGRWVVMCMVHHTTCNVTSVANGRPLLKVPEFCEECMGVGHGS